MRPKDRTACLWMMAFCVTALSYPFTPTTPRYYPLDHALRWENIAGVASMGWYGKAAWALAAGMLAAALLGCILPRFTDRAGKALIQSLTLGVFCAYPVAVALMILHEFVWKAH